MMKIDSIFYKKILIICSLCLFLPNNITMASENKSETDNNNVLITINKSEQLPIKKKSKIKDTKTILGILAKNWKESLDNLKYVYDDDFLLKIESESNSLKNKKDSECFIKLNSESNSNFNKNNNPLLQLKHKKSKSKFITDLDLEKSDFIKVISLLPILNTSYNRDEIAKFIPYISLGLNYGLNINELNYYLKDDARKQIPADIATQRLYNIVKDNQ